VSLTELENVIIAYEPVWAIGTGITATQEQAQQSHKLIRSLLTDLYNEAAAQSVVIQYGGSMNPENVKNLVAQPDIDGGLIGGASLNAKSFAKIINHSGQTDRTAR